MPCGYITEGYVDLFVLGQLRSVSPKVPQCVAKVRIQAVVFALYSVGETRAVLLHVGEVDRQRVPLWTQELLRILEVKRLGVLSCTISGEGGRGVTRLARSSNTRSHNRCLSYSSRKVWNDFCTRSPSLSSTTAPTAGPLTWVVMSMPTFGGRLAPVVT